MHIVDAAWKKAGKGFDSGIRFWNDEKKLSYLTLSPGMEIAWTIRGPRRCIGRYDEYRSMISCPLNSLVVKEKKCNECRSLDGFDPCIRCTGSLCKASPQRYQDCKSSGYAVYLAYFSDGSLKVGVSSVQRATIRWLEQGADFATIIANVVGGDSARKLEQELGKNHGVKLAVSGTTKANSILSKPSQEVAEHAFREFLDQVNCETCTEELKITNLSRYYHLNELDTKPEYWPDRNAPLVGQQITGTIMGMKGALLITYIGHSYRIISLKRLVGYTLETSIDKPIIAQTGLLDFID